MLASLLQQSARRYATITHRRYNPRDRARIRAFFAGGLNDMLAPLVAEALPAMLHLSVFLFFGGLLVFLFNVDHSTNVDHPTFKAVVWWVALSAALYAWITIIPFFRHDSPYYAPFFEAIRFLYCGISYVICETQESSAEFLTSMETKALEEVDKLSSKMDARVLEWAVGALPEDDSLEGFFQAIPGFYHAEEVTDFQKHLSSSFQTKFAQSLNGFLDRTLLSNSVSEPGKINRLITCLDAAYVVEASSVLPILRDISDVGRWKEQSRSVRVGLSLTSWANSRDGDSALLARIIVSNIVASAQQRDDTWSTLVKDHLCISDDVFQEYLQYGDSVLLANFMHITRLTLHSNIEKKDTLQPPISKFDLQNISPGLRDKFRDFWNEIVHELLFEKKKEEERKDKEAKEREIKGEEDRRKEKEETGGNIKKGKKQDKKKKKEREEKEDPKPGLIDVLTSIRHIYDAFNQGMPAAQTASSISSATPKPILYRRHSYPLCNVPIHQSGLISLPCIPNSEATEGLGETAPTEGLGETAPTTYPSNYTPSTGLNAHSVQASPTHPTPLRDRTFDAQQHSTPFPSSSHVTIEMLGRIHTTPSDGDTASAT
jgi:hypothetical protein